MSFLQNSPTPKDPITEQGQTCAWKWVQWFVSLATSVDATSQALGRTSLPPTQSASILSTPIPTAALSEGLYTVRYAARITTAAATSSSLTVAIQWQDGGVTQTFTGAAMTGNTTATNQSNVQMVHIDGNTPITYSTTYVSTPAGMTYSLYVVLERSGTV